MDSWNAQPLARQISPIRRTSRRLRIPHLQIVCLTNLNRSVFGGHQLPFRVPYHQPDQIASRLYIETCLERTARVEFVLQSLILQMHGEYLFRALNKISVAIEHGERTSQDVVITAIGFSKAQTLYVDVGEDDKFGIPISSFEKLSVQVYRKIVQLFLGIHLVHNFLLGLLVWAGEVLGRVIAAAGLQRQLLRALQRHL